MWLGVGGNRALLSAEDVDLSESQSVSWPGREERGQPQRTLLHPGSGKVSNHDKVTGFLGSISAAPRQSRRRWESGVLNDLTGLQPDKEGGRVWGLHKHITVTLSCLTPTSGLMAFMLLRQSPDVCGSAQPVIFLFLPSVTIPLCQVCHAGKRKVLNENPVAPGQRCTGQSGGLGSRHHGGCWACSINGIL